MSARVSCYRECSPVLESASLFFSAVKSTSQKSNHKMLQSKSLGRMVGNTRPFGRKVFRRKPKECERKVERKAASYESNFSSSSSFSSLLCFFFLSTNKGSEDASSRLCGDTVGSGTVGSLLLLLSGLIVSSLGSSLRSVGSQKLVKDLRLTKL